MSAAPGRSHRGRFEFVDAVTSDVCFVARGARVEDVFTAAAEALLATVVENPEAVGTARRRELELCESDLELLLLAFLSELVYLCDAERLLLRATALRIARGPEGPRLTATLAGEAIDPARHRLATEVKAVTAHGLRVREIGEGFEARVILDV